MCPYYSIDNNNDDDTDNNSINLDGNDVDDAIASMSNALVLVANIVSLFTTLSRSAKIFFLISIFS